MVINATTKQFEDEGELTCNHCGHKGHDVHTHFQHVGGKGHIQTPPECDDIPGCWNRWDKAHGLKPAVAR